jgi:GGDEF domain-containing protein
LAIAHDQLLVIASTDGLTSCLNRVASTLREVDLVGRMGGEEPSRALL